MLIFLPPSPIFPVPPANLSPEKMSVDRTESHVLEELDTANVNVTEDEEEDELARERAIREEEVSEDEQQLADCQPSP